MSPKRLYGRALLASSKRVFLARLSSGPGCRMVRTHYFVITPEVGTDETVHALRQGWMRSIPHERLHFCVASGSDSAHLGREPTMLLLQGVQRSAGTPVARDAYWHDREISASQRLALKESYNSFLRSKVLRARAAPLPVRHTCLCLASCSCAIPYHVPCAPCHVPALPGARHGA